MIGIDVVDADSRVPHAHFFGGGLGDGRFFPHHGFRSARLMNADC